MLITPVDIDPFVDHREQTPCERLAFTRQVANGIEARQQAALVIGDEAQEFAAAYNALPAPLMPSGLLSAHDASIVSDGLLLLDNDLIVGSCLMAPFSVFPFSHYPIPFVRVDRQEFYSFDAPQQTIFMSGLTANLCCDGADIYGHWIVDVLPRLYRVLKAGIRIDHFVFSGSSRSWKCDMLRALNLDLSRCEFIDFSKSTVKCERVVVPTFDRFNSEVPKSSIEVHRSIIDLYASDVVPSRHLFVSRRSWHGARPVENRYEMECAVKKLGLEIVEPQKYSFIGQVRLFASALTVVGETGSGMHNAVFCPSGTRIGLIQSADNRNFLQAQLGKHLGHEIFFLICNTKKKASGEITYEIDLGDVRRMVRCMAGNLPDESRVGL